MNKQNNDWSREVKLILINSGLINEDGWITTGTESSDFSDEFEVAVNKLNDYITNLLKEQLEFTNAKFQTMIDEMWLDYEKSRYETGWNSALAELEARLKIKEGKE